jgi:hypothetical protein
MLVIEDIEANEVKLQKAKPAISNFSATAMSMPMALPGLPIKENQEPRA